MKKVLVLEEDHFARKAISCLLASIGNTPMEATNLTEARNFSEGEIDVIICGDIDLSRDTIDDIIDWVKEVLAGNTSATVYTVTKNPEEQALLFQVGCVPAEKARIVSTIHHN